LGPSDQGVYSNETPFHVDAVSDEAGPRHVVDRADPATVGRETVVEVQNLVGAAGRIAIVDPHPLAMIPVSRSDRGLVAVVHGHVAQPQQLDDSRAIVHAFLKYGWPVTENDRGCRIDV